MRRRPAISIEAISSLLKTLYGAPLDMTQWPIFLSEFAHLVKLPAVAIHHQDFAKKAYQFNISTGMDLGTLSQYEKHFGKLDPYWPEFLKMPEDKLAFGEVMCPTKKLLKTEFYQDFLSTHDEVLGVYASVAMTKQPAHWQAITLYRRLMDSHPGPDTAAVISTLVPHIRSALQLQHHIAELTSARSSLESGIDALGLAVLLLDELGSCIFASRKADRLLIAGNGLRLKHGKLSAERDSESAAILSLVMKTLATARSGGVQPGAPIFVSRPPRGALRISAIALSKTSAQFAVSTPRQAAAIVFIKDPDEGERPLTGVLSIIYGLTPAEARLSILLYEGRSLLESADANGVSIETVRAQLKSIFQKTGIHRQASLIRLIGELAKTQ